MNSSAAPVLTVYRNGAAFAPPTPPALTNPGTGQYRVTLALTAANGFAFADWVSITADLVLDGAMITALVWQGPIGQAGSGDDVPFPATIYPLFTLRRPSTGENQNPDNGASPVLTVYRNGLATLIVPVLANPAAGVWIATLPIDAANGWSMGDELAIWSTGNIDGIPAGGWVIDSYAVSGGGGGGAGNNLLHVQTLTVA